METKGAAAIWHWARPKTEDLLEFSPLSSSAAADRVRKEVGRLGLEANIVDLEMSGVTIVPPEKAGVGREFLDRLRTAMLRVMGERNNVDLFPATIEQ